MRRVSGVSKAYTQMDEIDRNAGLSREDKQRQRSEVAAHDASISFDTSVEAPLRGVSLCSAIGL
jgi:hypothetical protein